MDFWATTIDGLEAELRGKAGAEVKKAPPFNRGILMALELYVMSARPEFRKGVGLVQAGEGLRLSAL